MRLTLIDLLIWIALAFFGMLMVRWLVPAARFQGPAFVLLQVGAAVVAYVVVASFLYRCMRFWPLLVPKCPHCGKRPSAIEVSGSWPILAMLCGACGGQTEVRMHKGVVTAGDATAPCLQLQWPYFLGWYRRLR